MTQLDSIAARLKAVGQDHLLRFHDSLSPGQRDDLLGQIAALDLDAIRDLVQRYVTGNPKINLPARVEPAPYYPADPDSPPRPWDRAEARRRGERLLGEGKVAAFTVAGGQGTRLGFDGPKGCFAAGAVTDKPLFQIFAEQILATSRRYGAGLPWFIMTSPLNHDQTVAFFREHAFFGLDESGVSFFRQGVMPSFEIATGRILLADRHRLATNPDGHGGSITALYKSGALDQMRARGVEHICYFQVDNPLVRIADPVFLGLHAGAEDSSAQMSSKMLPKARPDERVGVFCLGDGRLCMIEYSDLPEDLQQQRLDDGSLRFKAGNPAIHILSVAFVHRLNTDPSSALPFHRALKKVPYVELESGKRIEPDEPNVVKLERFVFDALPLADRSIVLETDRVQEFAPIKNATGVDSAETSRALQTERAARWLESVGVRVPRTPDGRPDCVLEISPLTALEAEDLRGATLPTAIGPGGRVAL